VDLGHPRGYVWRHVHLPSGRQRSILLRREILQPPPGVEVAHRSGDQLDNRRENLVVVTASERAAVIAGRVQRAGLRASNSSGFRGVSWDRTRQAWYAKIRVSGNLRNLGSFSSPEAAARAWDSAARQVWGEGAYQNFGPAGESEEGREQGKGVGVQPAPDAA
jgi:HNH endonuclease